MKYKHWLAIAALATLGGWAAVVHAATHELENSQYFVRTWQTEDGLPRNTINCIAQTPDGYLWLGTPFGIVLFDGMTFTRLETRDSTSFAHQRTRFLYLDQKNRMWVGTGAAGIVRYDGHEIRVIDGHNGLPNPTITALCEDPQGKMWVGTQEGGICWLDADDQAHQVEILPLGRDFTATQILGDGCGRMWFAGWRGYGQLVNGSATNIIQSPNLVTLCHSRDGGVWVSDQNFLRKIGASSEITNTETISLPVNCRQIRTMTEDAQGNLWLGTVGQGLYRYTAGQFVLELQTALRIQTLFQDKEANLWIGTDGGGLSRLRPSIFRMINTTRGLARSMVFSLCESEDGTIWLAPQGRGLARWKNTGQVEFLPAASNLAVTAVLPYPSGGAWVGTSGSGLYLANHEDLQRLTHKGVLDDRQIRVLHQDAASNLWIGCLPSGLAKLSGNQLIPPRFFQEQGCPTAAIWAIADDERTNLWLGTIAGDLWHYDGNNFLQLGMSNGLPGASIAALHIDQAGALWIGTLGGGLGRYKEGRFAFANVRDGLDDDVISAIVDDSLGYFWLASERGIFRVSQRDLNEFADGHRSHFDSIRYGKNDGLDSVHSAGGYQPAAWTSGSGKIWFATSKGAVEVDPASLKINSHPPTLVLQEILVDDLAITNQADLRLGYGYGKLEFRYTAASFTSPEQVRFRRQLVGFDPDWVTADQLRAAVYPRLAPGPYKFRFTACNSDGVWNDQPVEVSFVVTPAFWQTNWFRALAALVFTAIIVGIARYRYVLKLRRKLRSLEQIHAIERERMRIARDIHDDLGARLTQMAFLSEMAAGEIGEHSKTVQRLDRVAQDSREAIRSLEEIVWAVNPRKDTLSDLVDYLSHYANEFFRPTDIRCRQDLPLIIPEKTLSAETRHHLFLACKEALNNIRKHAQATEVWLRLVVSNSSLELTVEDNGVGLSEKSKPGNGLQNIQTRLAALGGKFHLDTSPGKGTRVRMTIDFPSGKLENHTPSKETPS